MKKDIFVVGNLVDLPVETLLSKHDSDNIVLFVGKMSYEPNVIAVSYFAHEIFPILKSRFKQLKFIIAGANPDQRVVELEKITGIQVTGFVETLIPYFQKATVVIAPMLTGAGIQNKIIQAMSFACCVATTPIGAEGLDIRNNEIAVFSTDDEWIIGLENLLIDRQERKAMGLKARTYVEENLSRDSISKQFDSFIDYSLR